MINLSGCARAPKKEKPLHHSAEILSENLTIAHQKRHKQSIRSLLLGDDSLMNPRLIHLRSELIRREEHHPTGRLDNPRYILG